MFRTISKRSFLPIWENKREGLWIFKIFYSSFRVAQFWKSGSILPALNRTFRIYRELEVLNERIIKIDMNCEFHISKIIETGWTYQFLIKSKWNGFIAVQKKVCFSSLVICNVFWSHISSNQLDKKREIINQKNKRKIQIVCIVQKSK